MKETLVVIVGPTAVGKTKLSVEMAKALDGEIINGDAMQVYKGLDIGTAKITPTEAENIPHHLIDFLNPDASYTVAQFQKDARRAIKDIHGRGNLPILVGGTGLYIQSVTHNYQFNKTSDEDPAYRQQLENRAFVEGPVELHNQLQNIDPESADKIHPNNVRRVIRALEIFHTTGKAASAASPSSEPEALYDVIFIGLTMDRELLYERINLRVDQMISKGLEEETRRLYNQGLAGAQATQAIGYKEIFDYFSGEIDFEEAIRLIKRNSRRFAKRQFTWFRNKMEIHWFDMTEAIQDFNKKAEEIIKFVEGICKERAK